MPRATDGSRLALVRTRPQGRRGVAGGRAELHRCSQECRALGPQRLGTAALEHCFSQATLLHFRDTRGLFSRSATRRPRHLSF